MRLENTCWIARPVASRASRCCVGWAMVAAGLAWSVAGAGSAAASTAVSYVGASNGSWNAASNWSPAVVPANSGASQFTVTIAVNPVVFNLGGNTTINDLILSQSLQLNSGCNLTVANQLSLSTASITANGGNFTANGPATTATDTSLNAESGAQVVLPALAQITNNNVFYGGLQANGAGSLLDLSQVTTIAVNNLQSTTVQAGSGGEVNLHNLLSVTSTNGSTLGLTASGGTIDVSSLGGGASNSGVGSVSLSNSGTVLWGSPTSLNALSLKVTGAGNTINLSQIATATSVSFDAEGRAQVVLPALTQITVNNPFVELQANGAGSLLDLSHVTTMAVNNTFASVQAGSGGEVNLHNVLSVTSSNGNTLSLSLTASGGTIDVSSLGGGTSNSGVGSVTLSNSGAVLWGSPTSLTTFALKVTGAGNTIALSQIATATSVSFDAEGGAQVALPALAQITDNNASLGTLQANGAGSLLDLSHVTTMAVNNFQSTTVQAGSGGLVNLHNLFSVTSTNGNTMSLNASGGTIDVSSLGGGTSNSGVGSVTLSNSGTVLWGSPTSLTTFALTVTGTGNTIDLSHVATATSASFNAQAGAQLSLPALTQDTAGSLTASGGTISLPSLGGGASNSGIGSVTLSNSGAVLWGSPTSLNTLSLKVTGAGNTIDLSHVATATAVSFDAESGAQVALPALTQITINNPFAGLQANGASSLLDLSYATTMALNGAFASVQAGSGGEVNLSHVTTMAVNNAFASVQAGSGGLVNLHNLLSITSTNGNTMSLTASGGTIDASSLSAGPGSFQVQAGGSLLLASLNLHSSSLTVTGANSILTVKGSLSGDVTSSVSLGASTTVYVGGSLSNAATNEASWTASSATADFIGLGQHTLEVAGLDLGAVSPGNSGNFGLGQLVVGQSNSPATLTLVDLLNNGNRSDGNEALYLFGSGGGPGLSLLDGSTLVLNHLDAYNYVNGGWVSLQSVLGGSNEVAFDGGYLAQQAIPEPSAWALLAAAAGFIFCIRRRLL